MKRLGWLRSGYRVPYDAVRIALGLLLLVAAALKGYQLATEPVLAPHVDGPWWATGLTALLASRWLLLGAVEFELFFGLWLLAGLYPRQTRALAIGCFALFAAVSLFKALSGAASCGCFGKVAVSPWLTLALDIFAAVVLLLVRFRAEPEMRRPRLPAHAWTLGILGITWLAVGGVAALGIARGPGTLANDDSEDAPTGTRIVEVGPAKVSVDRLAHDFGVLKPFSVASEIKARPAVVDFGPVAPGDNPAPVVVSVQHGAQRPLEVSAVEVPEGYVAAIEESGAVARLAVSLRRALTSSNCGVIKIRARWVGGEETIELPCYMYLRPK